MNAKHTRCFPILATTLLVFAATAFGESGKIPVTTRSEDARKEFLTGRQLFENLKRKASVDHFRTAAKLDPEFALAYAYLAQSEGTARAFFDNLEKAASLS